MAKKTYKIPFGLEQSYSDMTIALQSKDGSVGKVLPLLAVASYVISFLTCLFILTKTPIGTVSSIGQKVIFVILWAALTIVLVKYDGTRRMNLQRVITLLNYTKKSRHVYTRNHNDAGPFWSIVGIESISDDGLIQYSDGTCGYIYRVVGSASVLLFESDKEAILNRVDNFFKKWELGCEIEFITTKEAQKVNRQLYNLRRRYTSLRGDDADLIAIAELQADVLREFVGNDFKSIHQYMVLKASSETSLVSANRILQNEVESSALMFKQCVCLDSREDCYEFLASIFRKGDFVNGN